MTKKAADKPLNNRVNGTGVESQYAQSDKELEKALVQAFGEGVPSLEIRLGPTQSIVVTREEFFEAKNNAPAEFQFLPLAVRVMKVATRKYQVEAEKRGKLQAMFMAKLEQGGIRYINPDSPPGEDVNGDKFDISGRVLVPTSHYPGQAEVLDGEMGCLMDEAMTQPFIRLVVVEELTDEEKASKTPAIKADDHGNEATSAGRGH